MKNVNKFYLLKLKANQAEDETSLAVLHNVILTQELGFNEEDQALQDGIKYTDQLQEAFNLIDMGRGEASFILV